MAVVPEAVVAETRGVAVVSEIVAPKKCGVAVVPEAVTTRDRCESPAKGRHY